MAFTNAGYGGSNANAGVGMSSPLASWNQAQQSYFSQHPIAPVGSGSQYAGQMHPGTGVGSNPAGTYNPANYGVGGYSAGGMGFNQQAVQNLANQQLQAFNQANATNTGRWSQGVGYLQNAQSQYFADPAHQGAQGLAQYLTQNPDVLSNGVQAQIQNNAANMINANMGAQARQQAGILAGNGETDAGSLAAMNNQIYRQGVGQLGAVQSNLDIQSALQNRASTLQALQAGQSQAAQNYGVNQNMANSYLQNVLYQKPFDYSAFLPATMQSGGAAVGSGGAGQGFGFGGNLGGYGTQNFVSPTSMGGWKGQAVNNGSAAPIGTGLSLGSYGNGDYSRPNGPGAFFMNNTYGNNPSDNGSSIYNQNGTYNNNFYGE